MSYQVIVTNVVARPTAVVPATTNWQEFPALWRELLDEVWACLHAGGITRGCRNIMLYWDDVPHVEVGVELFVPCPLTGRVVASALPENSRYIKILHFPTNFSKFFVHLFEISSNPPSTAKVILTARLLIGYTLQQEI